MTSEQIAQINIFNWLEWKYPDIFKDTFHFANERRCSIQQGRLLKRMGVKKGVADIFIAVPNDKKSGLWIELKVNNGKASKEQNEFLARMKERNFEAKLAMSEDEAKYIIYNYLNNK